MFNQFKLLETNPQLGLKNGIHQDTGEIFRDSTLSNYIQIAASDVFAEVDDKSLFSLSIEQAIQTPELQDALSIKRFRFLEALDLSNVHTALDLSEDFGGVAHFLADKVNQVEALKVDPDLARLSSTRCANKPNVCHISEDLDKLVFPQGHYGLIVLGQLEKLDLTTHEFSCLLHKLRAALLPTGVLVVNAKNQSSLAKWLNKGNDQIPYSGLYKSTKYLDSCNEIERRTLRNLLLDSGFAASDFHVNFSTGQDCNNLFSEDYLTSCVNGLNHFYRLGSIDNPDINEFLMYKKLVDEKRNIVDLASRFVVLAGASTVNTRSIYDNDFSHFPGNSRKPAWRARTQRQRAAHNVEKIPAYPQQTINSELVSQNLAPAPYYKGRVLVNDWLQALLDQDHHTFENLVDEYNAWLESIANNPDFTQTAYDLLPFNIIVNERGGQRHFKSIDTEWEVHEDFSADFVLFRALFWFAFENKSVLKSYAESNHLYSISTFIIRYLPSAHSLDDLEQFIELEERIQAEINQDFRANAVSQALLQSFDSKAKIEAPLNLQAVWGKLNGQTQQSEAKIIDWQRSSTSQTLELGLARFDANNPALRIDPMDCSGALKIHSISVHNSEREELWAIDSHAQLDQCLTLSGLQIAGDLLIATNDDPYCVFDLSAIANIDSAAILKVVVEWHWGPDHSAALTTLSAAASSQNASLVGQSHRLDQYRADIEYQTQRIEDLLGHRKDLTEMLKDEERRVVQERNSKAPLYDQISHLEAHLHVQRVRNEELFGYLLMRPTTRVKRAARRWLNRLTGKPMVDPIPKLEPEPEPEPVVEAPEPMFPHDELIGQNTEDYQLWVSENSLSEADIAHAKADIDAMPYKPVFSILVPIYNTDPEYLLPMIESVQKQIYPYWQLCLVDDCSPKSYLKRILEHEALQDERISIQLNDVNQGISVTTNDALHMATGDYIALLDHDDEISIDALYENAKVINAQPEAGLIYSDEDKMDMQGNRLEPYFKPDYSPDLLDTNNYVCHFTIIKKSIADEIGGFREGLDGSQDHDIILRAADATSKVVHIPKILYHWRKIPGSTAVVYDSKSYAWEAGRKAVEDLRCKNEDNVRVEFGTLKGTYRVFREIKGEPLVSIVIPFKDKPELLDSCLNSILNRSSYANFEIVGVSNNSSEPLTHERMAHYQQADERVRFVEKNVPFNFSEICNYGVEQTSGDYIVLLNNDIEIITPDWIERMLEHAQRDEIGAVGAKLLYPDGRIQHAGVVAGMVGAAGHPHKFFPDNHIGYHGRLHMVYNVSAVTGAMMMMNKDKYLEVGGLDADNLAVAYNDIDLCLKLLDKGYYNLFTPHAKATHHESISRGYEDTEEKMQRLLKEQHCFLTRWDDFLAQGDPFYNPNLSLKNERFSLNFKD